ncbi:MAPK protein hog1 [Mortierella polycephala]|uniref:MAPK protein hog1 n=1 Tax=Mortierella polycephala TaxID=41804 RepID=A0A9P6PTK5_9FUNG|nr:MAPK protein hog1 [Mortierella polycephala]
MRSRFQGDKKSDSGHGSIRKVIHFWEVATRYVDLQPVGMGAFGLVCSANDELASRPVAIKKVMKSFSTAVLAKRPYRELKQLKHLKHGNVWIDSTIIGILRRTTWLNLWLQGYFVTVTWNRPTSSIDPSAFGKAVHLVLLVDIWNVGCIFAEMLEGKALFPGKDHVNQFSVIIELLGTPLSPDDVIQTVGSKNSLPEREKIPLTTKFPHSDSVGMCSKLVL